ncbi:AbgT family transporter [Vibrio sp. RE88]|uniref:YfcC family protein n=1 Tax=Vibrio sp. RE88 TaxID=2607610 RepID=UPI0014937BB3|nr:AbgT family transporter [Vibrio sp. RE88]NOH60541.1 YfcC family protein [Vibrio sp. RE88]
MEAQPSSNKEGVLNRHHPDHQPQQPKPGKWEMPDIYIILTVMILIVSVLTYAIPTGKFDRVILDNGRETVVAGSYQLVEASPVSAMEVVTAIPRGLSEASIVVFLTLLVGGSIGVLQQTGVINYGVNRLIKQLGSATYLMVPILMIAFAAICSFIGTPELGIAYLPIVIPLMLRLGYDSMTAVATVLISCTFGFAFGITSPTNVGLGHMLAELPMFSGAGFRVMVLALVMLVSIAFVVRYARKVKADPHSSLTYDQDVKLKLTILGHGEGEPEPEPTTRMKIAGLATLVMFVGIIASTLKFNLGFYELSGLFMTMAIITSLIIGHRGNQICNNFNTAFQGMLVGALITGVARAVSVVLSDGQILDTIVYSLSEMLGALPPSVTSIGILLTQAVFNFLVPSGSGQTLLTLPILLPLADLIGLTRQIVILATQWGDGVTNILFPTSGYFMAILVMARVDYMKWVRFFLPLLAVVIAIAITFLLIAQAIKLGPF